MSDITTLGHIIRWNHANSTTFWGENTVCDEVRGTDSTLYPPRVEKDNAFYIYSTDICRYVRIDYKKEGSYKEIDGYLFGTSETTLKSDNPEEDCYCTNKTKGLDGKPSCFLDGVVDMNTCIGLELFNAFQIFQTNVFRGARCVFFSPLLMG